MTLSAASGARRSAAICRRAGASPQPLEVPRSPPSTRSSRARRTARSRPPWRSCASSTRCCATRHIGKHVVPIVPDESRTFGMEGMFRQFGIFSPGGPALPAEDANQLMFYKEDRNGQMLQEGINEAGAMCSWIAAATAYSHVERADDPVLHLLLHVRLPAGRRSRLGGRRHAGARLPDRRHGRADHAQRRRPAARGRPQPLFSATIPNCVSYDPTFSYEVAVIVQDGLRRMYRRAGGCLLLHHRDERELRASGGCRRALKTASSRACTCSGKAQGTKKGPRVQLLGSGTILREVIAAADLLAEDFGVAADMWSCPSFTELRREAMDGRALEHASSDSEPRKSHVETCLRAATARRRRD